MIRVVSHALWAPIAPCRTAEGVSFVPGYVRRVCATRRQTGRRIGLEAEEYSPKTEQEGIDAGRLFDPGPTGSATQGAFAQRDWRAGGRRSGWTHR